MVTGTNRNAKRFVGGVNVFFSKLFLSICCGAVKGFLKTSCMQRVWSINKKILQKNHPTKTTNTCQKILAFYSIELRLVQHFSKSTLYSKSLTKLTDICIREHHGIVLGHCQRLLSIKAVCASPAEEKKTTQSTHACTPTPPPPPHTHTHTCTQTHTHSLFFLLNLIIIFCGQIFFWCSLTSFLSFIFFCLFLVFLTRFL